MMHGRLNVSKIGGYMRQTIRTIYVAFGEGFDVHSVGGTTNGMCIQEIKDESTDKEHIYTGYGFFKEKVFQIIGLPVQITYSQPIP